jgi:sigma-B regulation protein RsbU (phosphoserine phosphatase)
VTDLHAERANLLAPLNLIVALSERLFGTARDAGSEHLAVDLKRIHDSGVSLRALITQLLDGGLVGTEHAGPQTLRHELNTPLNHILGYTELLLEEVTDAATPDFVDAVERIRAAARQALVLITRVLGPAMPAPAMAEPAGVAPVPPGESGSVLVVEDDPINREILERHLTRQGYQVLLAKGGRQALDMLAATRVDVVLLDLVMPEMDGHDTLERLKSDPELSDIPVIVLSALDDLESVVRCMEIGAEDYIQKPFNPVLLNARLGGCIGRKRLRDREVRALQNRVFQRMAQLQTRQQDVDALVAERTRALEARVRELERLLDAVQAVLDNRLPPAAR